MLSATIDGGAREPSLVGNQHILAKAEDSATIVDEDGPEGVYEGIPKNTVDESTLEAVADNAPIVAADEAVNALAPDEDLPVIAASKDESNIPVDDTRTTDKDGATIAAGKSVPAVTIDSRSPFLIHSTQTNGPEDITETHNESIDRAKSTSFEDPLTNGNSSSNLKGRVSSAVERPVTPASIHTALNGKMPHNFFRTLWRTVFVRWIGGLMRLVFGGGRGS
jgi:hypothetical protein